MRSARIGLSSLCICASLLASEGESPAPMATDTGSPSLESFEALGPGLRFRLEAPNLQVIDGAGYAAEGFVLHIPRQNLPDDHPLAGLLQETGALITGDGLRWDRASGCWFFFGSINLILDGLHIQADRMGFDPRNQRGDIWQARIALVRPDGLLAEATAHHLALEQRVVTIDRISARSGHGSLLRFQAARLRLRLTDPDRPNEHRSGFLRLVRDITVHRPLGRVAEIPALWLPIAYRDYTLDYPWTYIEMGVDRSQGYQIGISIAERLPPIFGWRLRPGARYTWRDRSGEGYGAFLSWRHDAVGRGRAVYFLADDERVYGDGGDTLIQRRDSDLRDFAHRGRWRGPLGDIGLDLRHTTLPDPDRDRGGIADERFRRDYFASDLEERPLARQGGAIVWSGSLGSLRATRERPPHESIDASLERHHAIDAALNAVSLLGPLHVGFTAQAADLERRLIRAERYTGEAHLLGRWWWGGLGTTLVGGARLLGYDDAHDHGTDTALQDGSAFDWYPYLEGSIGPVIRGDFANLTHLIEPRIGLLFHGERHRDPDHLPDLDFGDGFDTLADDQQRLTLGLTTSLSGGGRSFTLSVDSQWALRNDERRYRDDHGVEQIASSHLARLDLSANGTPFSGCTITARGSYDGLREQFDRFDSTTGIVIGPVDAGLAVNWRLDSTDEEIWTYRPRLAIAAGRYDVSLELQLQAGGRTLDHYRWGIHRQLVDGRLGITYSRRHDADGQLDSEQVMLAYSFTPFLGRSLSR